MSLAFPEELAVGVREVDEQHRAFYATINQLHDSMREHDLHRVLETFDRLDEYASAHFATEERMMIDAGYAGFPEHLVHHADFRRELSRRRARLTEEGPSAGLVVEISGWLTAWLRDHVRNVDSRMASFLRARGGAARGS